MKLKSLEFVESVENDEKYKVHFVISDFWFKTGVLFPGENSEQCYFSNTYILFYFY